MANKLPQGCDQQGRHPEAAEAVTEVGQDDEDWGSDFISDFAITVMVLAVIGAIVAKAAGLV
jgi:hypothetical protein